MAGLDGPGLLRAAGTLALPEAIENTQQVTTDNHELTHQTYNSLMRESQGARLMGPLPINNFVILCAYISSVITTMGIIPTACVFISYTHIDISPTGYTYSCVWLGR